MHVLTLGTNITTGKGIALADVDRRRHLYCVGGSGAGKTNWLLSLMAQDLNAGRGFCFIDKHGDAAKQLADSALHLLAARGPIALRRAQWLAGQLCKLR
jgi:hypothetical protein